MRQPFIKKTCKIISDIGYEDAESIERYCERITTTNEPVEATVPMIYTERSKGVLPETDIRTDRWEVAQNAMERVAGAKRAKREERIRSIDNIENKNLNTEPNTPNNEPNTPNGK